MEGNIQSERGYVMEKGFDMQNKYRSKNGEKKKTGREIIYVCEMEPAADLRGRY